MDDINNILKNMDKYRNIITRGFLDDKESLRHLIDYFKEHPEGDLVVNIPIKAGLKENEFYITLDIFENPSWYGLRESHLVEFGTKGFREGDGTPFLVKSVKLADGVTPDELDRFFDEYSKSGIKIETEYNC